MYYRDYEDNNTRAPYGDEKMKEIFHLTIAVFENLSHVSSRYYTKAVFILETIAKVKSCLVMLDLECDALVVEMFQTSSKSLVPTIHLMYF